MCVCLFRKLWASTNEVSKSEIHVDIFWLLISCWKLVAMAFQGKNASHWNMIMKKILHKTVYTQRQGKKHNLISAFNVNLFKLNQIRHWYNWNWGSISSSSIKASYLKKKSQIITKAQIRCLWDQEKYFS